MARKPRIEFAGAVYHLMNRGDHGEEVFSDELDYGIFLGDLGQCCRRCGWIVHSYCLLKNHFHALVETPEPNLVAGMKWFMGAYTRKYNVRHGLKGHLFQGRYKAQLVEPENGNYFETVATYIHLNPARAGLLRRQSPVLAEYKRSSYVHYIQEKDRPVWLEVRRVLGNMGLKDNAGGRAAYVEYMQGRLGEMMTRKGRKMYNDVWKLIKDGWCVGSEAFEKDMLVKLKDSIADGERESYTGVEMARHGEAEAEKIVVLGLKRLGIKEQDLNLLKMGAKEKGLLAWQVYRQAMVSHKWIAERLKMGVPVNVGKYIKQIAASEDRKIVNLRKTLEKD